MFSKFSLLCMSLLDLPLSVATVVDLDSDRSAEFAHGLAAIYLGFTVIAGAAIFNGRIVMYLAN